MKLVVDDAITLAEALEQVVADPSLKETWFTTPLALHVAEQPRKYRKGDGKAPPPPLVPKHPGKSVKTPKGGAKTQSKLGGLELVSTTPDGKQICYAFNAQGCKNKSCARVHVCRVAGCFGDHAAHQHEAVMQSQRGG